MALSGGIPYFCGDRIAHNAEITSMTGTIQPVVKVYPRTIGGVLKGGGVVSKTISLQCRVIPPTTATRADLEQFMNTFNEDYGTQVGSLVVDDNEYLDCGINNIRYDPKITKGFLIYDIEFELGVQSETTVVRQLVPSKLFADTRGRPAIFSKIYGEGIDETTKNFNIWHNVDIVRDLENRLVLELYDINNKDNTIKFNGGFETVTAYCWMKATGEDQEDGWKQTVGAYIYNIINGPLGEIGTLYLGGNTIENCLWTEVNLVEVFPTSARYELTFIVSLQC